MPTLSGELRAHKARLQLTLAQVAERIGRSVSSVQRWLDPTSSAYHEGRHHALERLTVADLELLAQFLEITPARAFKLWKEEMSAWTPPAEEAQEERHNANP